MMMMRSFSEKTRLNMMRSGKKDDVDSKNVKNNRFLITINVFGSAGPLRFVVSQDDNSARVIETTLKLYAREGRLPILGLDTNCFILYRANAEFDALKPWETIGSYDVRNFVLCKKENVKTNMTQGRSELINTKKYRGWFVWLQKSFSLKILPH
ncbi:uncharacterized protein At4g22758-like [Andrographis paniculata]|uniref:uncharacterized protein At4g22758-like n=1 Tax=Andrographis paniculata TaxID=175694 RepID=UPI0021E892FB|nr:uncharacterized protein At4g22758-like [Andrographis paniculata]